MSGALVWMQWRIQRGGGSGFAWIPLSVPVFEHPKKIFKKISVRPNYFISMGYLRKMRQISKANPRTFIYMNPFPEILDQPLEWVCVLPYLNLCWMRRAFCWLLLLMMILTNTGSFNFIGRSLQGPNCAYCIERGSARDNMDCGASVDGWQ